MKPLHNKMIWVLGAISIVLIVLVGFILKRGACNHMRNTCCNRLMQIDSAKEQAALVYGWARCKPVPVEKLQPYLKGGAVPTCPTDGTYRIGVLGLSANTNVAALLKNYGAKK
jgi:hypothetical protein